MSAPKWVPLAGLARAYVRGECLPDLLKRFDEAYLQRLRMGAEMSACWDALKDVKLPWQSQRVQDLAGSCPLRKGKYGATEIDLANVAPLLLEEAKKQTIPKAPPVVRKFMIQLDKNLGTVIKRIVKEAPPTKKKSTGKLPEKKKAGRNVKRR